MLETKIAPLKITTAPSRLHVCGDWTLPHYAMLRREIEKAQPAMDTTIQVELNELRALDTAGARLLVRLFGTEYLNKLASEDPTLSAERRALLHTVCTALRTYDDESVNIRKPFGTLVETLSRIGFAIVALSKQTMQLLSFIGLTLESLALNAFHPKRWRLTPLVAHLEQTGFDAVPIITLLTFLVGAVLAFLGKSILSEFGAAHYTVNLVGFSFLREFGVLLTAILMAGRTASAFTAQIGAMKTNEEIDAIRTIGLNPIELLVLPRVLALLVTLPLLTFLAMLAGIVGGGVVCMSALAISPTMFLTILQETIPVRHFFIGMAKAPIFAFLIAIIGCLEGFKVKGSAQSLGQRTTSSVVQSIFVVILLDAVAALFFMEMDW